MKQRPFKIEKGEVPGSNEFSPGNMTMRKLIFTAVNAVTSSELLAVVPHRVICNGMAIVYRYVENGRFTNVITHEVAMELGFTEPQLYEMSLNNFRHFLPVLKEEDDGVYTIASLTNELVGPSMVFMPELLDRVLNKTGEEQVYVAIEPERTTVSTKIASVFNRLMEGNVIGRVMKYTRQGFTTIGFAHQI